VAWLRQPHLVPCSGGLRRDSPEARRQKGSVSTVSLATTPRERAHSDQPNNGPGRPHGLRPLCTPTAHHTCPPTGRVSQPRSLVSWPSFGTKHPRGVATHATARGHPISIPVPRCNTHSGRWGIVSLAPRLSYTTSYQHTVVGNNVP
jgi:hypothetical protein